MKLLHCFDCQTIRNIKNIVTTCDCGKVKAKYVTDTKIEWNEKGAILGISNTSFKFALSKQNKKSLLGYDFEAFVISSNSESYVAASFE